MKEEQIIELNNYLRNNSFKIRQEDDGTVFYREIIDDGLYVAFSFYTDNTIKVIANNYATTYESNFVFNEQDDIKTNIVENIVHLIRPMLYDMLFDGKAGHGIEMPAKS